MKAALFDLGGVLIEWDPREVYQQAFPDSAEAVARFLCGPFTEVGLATCASPGPLADIVAPFFGRYPEHAPFLRLFVERWPSFVLGTFPESVALLARLRAAEVPLFGLTNWPEATFPPPGPEFEFLDWFRGIVVSGAEGLRKPGRAIFERTVERFSLTPQSTVYIDDHQDNIDTAASLGFRTHHFEHPATLAAFLVAEGLLSAQTGDE